MRPGEITYSRIAGTGGYLPERVLTNAYLARMVYTTDEWIVDRTGVRKRHIAAEGETTCDLAEHASRRALEAAGVVPRDIDLIVVGTASDERQAVAEGMTTLLQDGIIKVLRGHTDFQQVRAVCIK